MPSASAVSVLEEFRRSMPERRDSIWSRLRRRIESDPSPEDVTAALVIGHEYSRQESGATDFGLDRMLARMTQIARGKGGAELRGSALDFLRQHALGAQSAEAVLDAYTALWEVLTQEDDDTLVRFAGYSLVFLWSRWLTRVAIPTRRGDITEYLEEQRRTVSGDPRLRDGSLIEKWERESLAGDTRAPLSAALLATLDVYAHDPARAARLYDVLSAPEGWRDRVGYGSHLLERLDRLRSRNPAQTEDQDAFAELRLLPSDGIAFREESVRSADSWKEPPPDPGTGPTK